MFSTINQSSRHQRALENRSVANVVYATTSKTVFFCFGLLVFTNSHFCDRQKIKITKNE